MQRPCRIERVRKRFVKLTIRLRLGFRMAIAQAIEKIVNRFERSDDLDVVLSRAARKERRQNARARHVIRLIAQAGLRLRAQFIVGNALGQALSRVSALRASGTTCTKNVRRSKAPSNPPRSRNAKRRGPNSTRFTAQSISCESTR